MKSLLNLKPHFFLLAAVGSGVLATPAHAEFKLDAVELGLRYELNLGPGQPTNDINGYSFIARYKINKAWWVGAAIETGAAIDVETPYTLLGIQAEELDAKATSSMFSAWAERRYTAASGRRYLFWTAGLGFNSWDVNDLGGTATDGSSFYVVTDAGNETVLTVTGGQRHHLGKNLTVGYGVRAEQRFADWTLTDTVTDTASTIDDYFVHGFFADLNYRF